MSHKLRIEIHNQDPRPVLIHSQQFLRPKEITLFIKYISLGIRYIRYISLENFY